MNTGQLLIASGRFVRQHPGSLWLGALAVIWGGLGGVWFRLQLAPRLAALDWLDLLVNVRWSPEQVAGWLAGLLVVGLLAWLAGALSEAALIVLATGGTGQGSFSLSQSLRAGATRLPRLIAVDTVLFFPLFLVALALLLLPAGALLVAAGQSETGAVLAVVGWGAGGAAVLLCLALPLLLLTLLWRLLAFRAAIVDDLPWRAAIRTGGRLLRRHGAVVLGWGLLLLALPLLADLLVTGLWRPVAAATTGPGWGPVVGRGLALTAVQAIIRAFTTTAWTLFYRELAASGRAPAVPDPQPAIN